MRKFHYSKTITNKRKRKELKRQKFFDQVCFDEQRFINQGQRGNVIAFVGDREYSVGSQVKGFKKYGGKWKPHNYSRYISTIVINEFNTSEVCVYCSHKAIHLVHIVDNTLNTNIGTFVCTNPACIAQIRVLSQRERCHIFFCNWVIRLIAPCTWCSLLFIQS